MNVFTFSQSIGAEITSINIIFDTARTVVFISYNYYSYYGYNNIIIIKQ